MIFQSMILAAMAAVATADSIIPSFDVPASSRLGSKLLSKATPDSEGARKLEQQERDATWMYQYKIKYLSCSSLIQIAGEGGGGGGEEGALYTQHLVKFGVCKASDSCSSCSGDATYVVNMMDFVEAYTEYKLDEQEYMCEMIRENCYCDNANDDDACENQCYIDAGMSECIEYEGEEEFEVQRYLECAELEAGDNNNNNNGQNYNYNNNNNNNNNNVNRYAQYFTGPYCSEKDGKSILLGVFLDEGCTMHAQSGVYETFNYGRSLPFSTESMVKSDCISCLQVDNDNNNNNNNNNNGNNNNNNNNNNNYEVIELCERTVEQAAKCEDNLDLGQYYYPDTSGCTYIKNILPKLEKATRSITSGSSAAAVASSEGAATALAVIFAISTLVLGAYSFFLYRKIHRAKVNLSRADGVQA